MKITDQKAEIIPVTKSASAETLNKKVLEAEKHMESAWKDYEKNGAALEEARAQKLDKTTLRALMAAFKIAKFTYKIKRVNYKLAKSNWNTALKADKKLAKDSTKQKAKKVDQKAPQDTAAMGKGNPEQIKSAGPKSDKKKAESPA